MDNKFSSESESIKNLEEELLKSKNEIKKRDNFIKLLTGVIEVIKNDVDVKSKQLDYLINHMKDHNFIDDFDYKGCVVNSKSTKSLISEKDQKNKDKLSQTKTLDKDDKENNKLKFDLNFDKQITKNIFSMIAKFLDHQSLVSFSLTSKKLFYIANKEENWRDLFFNKFSTMYLKTKKSQSIVIENCKEKFLKNKNHYDDKFLNGEPIEEIYKEIESNPVNQSLYNFNFKENYISDCKLLKSWELGRPIVTTITMSGCVTCLHLDTYNNELLASSVDGSANLYRIYSNKSENDFNLLMQQHHKQTKICDRISSFQGHSGPIWCIDRHNDKVFTGSYDKTLKIWNVKSGNCLGTIRAHSSWVSSVQYDKDFGLLLSSSWDGSIKIWNIDTMQNMTTLMNSSGNFVYSAKSNLKEKEVLACTHMKAIDIWDVEKRILKDSLIGHLNRVSSIKIYDNQVFSGSEDKCARLWDKRTGKCEIQFEGHSRGITQIDFDPTISRFFTASHDATIKI